VDPCLVITVLHYRTGAHHAWGTTSSAGLLPADPVRRVFRRHAGRVTVSVFASCLSPHAFTSLLVQTRGRPGEGLEILLYNIVAVVAGLLVDRERRERSDRSGWQSGWETPRRAAQDRGAVDPSREARGTWRDDGGNRHEIKNPLHALKGTAEICGTPSGRRAERRMLELHIEEIDGLPDRRPVPLLCSPDPRGS